jgi:site-specific DNA-methyltransferase (adenine-specific)
VGKQLPKGRTAEIAALIGKDEREVTRRVQFAERFPTKEKVRHAMTDFHSWYRIVNECLASTAHLSAEKDDWSTPRELFEELDQEFGFTLDPCCSDFNHKTPRYYTVADDGLAQSWHGETVFMNPPYSAVDEWMAKARQEGENGATVVALVPSRTDVGWFWEHARFGEIRFVRGRLRFVDDEGNTGPAPFPSVVVVFGAGRSGVRW